MNDSSVPSCCCCRRLRVGFQLFSPFGFQSRRVASRRAVGRTSDQRSDASPSVRDKQSCVRLCPDPPAVCSPSSAHSFSHSFHPVPVWRSGAAFASRCWRRAAKMNTGEIHFIYRLLLCSSGCPVLSGVSSSCCQTGFSFILFSFIGFHSSVSRTNRIPTVITVKVEEQSAKKKKIQTEKPHPGPEKEVSSKKLR